MLARDEAGDQVHRAGAVQRHQRDDVLEAVRFRILQHALHAGGFELEHGDRLRLLQQLVRRRVVQRQRGDVQRRLAGFRAARVDRFHRPVDDGQRAQAEEVELHQTDRLDIVLVVLGDHAAAAGFAVQRGEIGERGRRDHHAAGVLAGVAREVFQAQRQVDQRVGVLVLRVGVAEFAHDTIGLLLRLLRQPQRIGQGQVERPRRDHLGQLVDLAVTHAEHAAGIAQHRLGRHRAVGDDLADLVATVLARDVVDHLVAAVHAEVDVEVGHRHAFGVEEALEQQVELQRVEIGDFQRPGDQRAGAGTAARAHRNAVLLAPVDEVRDDQKVAGKAHLDDDVQLALEPRVVVGARMAGGQRGEREALFQTLPREFADVAVEVVALGHREVRQVIGTELEFERAAPGELDGVCQRLGQVREQRGHFLRRLQVLLVGVFPRTLGVGQHAALVDAHARLVRVEVGLLEEAHVVAGQHRQVERGGQAQGGVVPEFLAVAAATGQLQVQPIRKQPHQRAQFRQRGVAALVLRDAGHFAVAAEQGDQPAAGLAMQPAGVDQRAAAVLAFLPGARHQPRQVEVAVVVLAQQRQPPRTRVVRRRDQQVAAADRLDPGGAAGLVELHQREHVAFVGQRHRRNAIAHASGDQRLDADSRIDQRILAVQVEVGEAGGHANLRALSVQATRHRRQRQD